MTIKNKLLLCDESHFDLVYFRMPLNTITLSVQSPKAYTHHGVPVVVSGVAQVRDMEGLGGGGGGGGVAIDTLFNKLYCCIVTILL